MVSMFASSGGIVGLSLGRVKSKTIKLVFVASLLSMQYLRRKSKDWLAWNQDIRRLLFQ
jgi:hypothetical protein